MPTYLRVRDKDTGHEFDVLKGDRRIGVLVELVKNYPENSGLTARPRPAKHRTDKAGKSATTTPKETGNG